MKTIEQLEVESLMLTQKLIEQAQVLEDLKSAKRELNIKISNAKLVAKRDAERRERNALNAIRRKAHRIANQYGIKWENDGYYDADGYTLIHYFPQPEWLEGDDPLTDGHYSYNWYDTLWLVEFYAKHHPDHPDHASREYLEVAPHC